MDEILSGNQKKFVVKSSSMSKLGDPDKNYEEKLLKKVKLLNED